MNEALSDCAEAKDHQVRHEPQQVKFEQVPSKTAEKSHQWIPPLLTEEERMKGICLCSVPGLDQMEAHGQ